MAHKFVDCISYYREKIFSHCYFLYKLQISEYCVYVADHYQHTIQCMYKNYLFDIWEVWAYLLWLRWKLGLLFRKRDKKYLQMVNCRSMDYTILSSYSKQGDDLTNCFSYKKGYATQRCLIEICYALFYTNKKWVPLSM